MGFPRTFATAVAVLLPIWAVPALAASKSSGEEMQKRHDRYCASKKVVDGERFAERLRGKLDLRDAQKPALNELRDAFAKAMADGKAALCSTKPDFNTTLGRFAFAKNRAEIRFERMKAMEPKLTALYNALDDKQKTALDDMRLWAPKKRNADDDKSSNDDDNE